MYNRKVLGSPFEMSLRILLMLNEAENHQLDIQSICAIDFIAIYAADFSLLDENLHGYGHYRYSEYLAKNELATSALKMLVLYETVEFFPNRNGFLYKINKSGEDVCNNLKNSYAEEYQIAVRAVLNNYNISNTKEMLTSINQHMLYSLQEDKQ